MRGLASAFSNFKPDATSAQDDFAMNTFEAMNRSRQRILGDKEVERDPSPDEQLEAPAYVSE